MAEFGVRPRRGRASGVGREIRVLNYYEAVGQPLSAHLAWLHAQDLGPD
jgi:phage terminase large subunit